MTLTDQAETRTGTSVATRPGAQPVQPGSAEAYAWSRAGVEARKRKAERSPAEIAVAALAGLLRTVETKVAEGWCPDDKALGGIVRALADVARDGGKADASAVATEVVAQLQRMAAQRGAGKGPAPATGQA